MNMHIPDELVRDILLRLPIKSLLRFKSVCKSWSNLISSKDFTLSQSNNFKTPSNHLVLAGIDTGCPQELTITSIVDYPLPKRHDFDKSWGLIGPEVCGPCNGILCLYMPFKGSILLWNPLINDFKTIPQSNLPLPLDLQRSFKLYYRVGFGFDSKTNDYKILKIVQEFYSFFPKPQVELYSLATNSWKKLGHTDIFCDNLLFTAAENRKIFWLGTGIGRREILFLFDVSDETCDMIIPPVSTDQDSGRNTLQVFPFRESIAVVISETADSFQILTGHCEIWVLNDFSCIEESRSWSILWTIQIQKLCWPLGFCGNSYLIFRCEEDGRKLKLYDLLNHHVVDIGASMVRPLVYKESLVSISGDKTNREIN